MIKVYSSLSYIQLQKDALYMSNNTNVIHYSSLNHDPYFSTLSFQSIGISTWLKIPANISVATIIKLIDNNNSTIKITTSNGNVEFFTIASQYEIDKWGYIFSQVNYSTGDIQLYYIGINGVVLHAITNQLNLINSTLVIQDIYVGGDESTFCSCSLSQVYLIPNYSIVSNSQLYLIAGGDIDYYVWYIFNNKLQINDISGNLHDITSTNNPLLYSLGKISNLDDIEGCFKINSTNYVTLSQQNQNWFTESTPSLTISFHFRINSNMPENQIPILSRISNENYIFIINMNLQSTSLDYMSISINNNQQSSIFQTGYNIKDNTWHHCLVQIICITASDGAFQYAKIDNIESNWTNNSQTGYADLTTDKIWIGKTDLSSTSYYWEIKDFSISRGTFKFNSLKNCSLDIGSTILWNSGTISSISSTLSCLNCPANFCMNISSTRKAASCTDLSTLSPCPNGSFTLNSNFTICDSRCVFFGTGCTDCENSPVSCLPGFYLHTQTNTCKKFTQGNLNVSEFDTLDIYLIFNSTLYNDNIPDLYELLILQISGLVNDEYKYTITQISNDNVTIRLDPIQIINHNILTLTIQDPSLILDSNNQPILTQVNNVTLRIYNPIAKMGFSVKTMLLIGTAVVVGSFPLIITGGLGVLWGLVDVLQYLFYFIYLNMKTPIEFKKFLIFFKIATLPLPNISLILFNILPKLEAPPRFDEFDIDALFLKTGLSYLIYTIFSFMIVFIMIGLDKLVYKCTRSNYLKILVKITKWNFPIRYILINIIQLSFANFLQYTNLSIDNTFFILSNIINILLSLSLLLLIIWLFKLTNTKLFKHKRSIFNCLYGTLTEEYVKDNTENISFIIRNYEIIQIIRKIIYIFGFVILCDYTVINLNFIMIQSLIMIYLLCKYSPYLRKSLNVKNIIQEGIFFLIALILLLVDQNAINHENILKIADYTLVILSCICFIYNLSFILIDLIKSIKILIISIGAYFKKNINLRKKRLVSNLFQIVPDISGYTNNMNDITNHDISLPTLNNNNNNNKTEHHEEDNINSPAPQTFTLFKYRQNNLSNTNHNIMEQSFDDNANLPPNGEFGLFKYRQEKYYMSV